MARTEPARADFANINHLFGVMAGLVPVIHIFFVHKHKMRDAALAITEEGLEELGLAVEHTNVPGSLSTIQQKLYQKFAAEGNKAITLAQAKAIEIKALIEGGVSRAKAEALVGKAVGKIEDELKALKLDPNTLQLHIPWLR